MPSLETILSDSIGQRALERYRETLRLPQPVPDFGEVPPTILLMLFSSRSGSTYAARLLGNTPHFGEVREVFNPDLLAFNRKHRELSDDVESAHWGVARWRGERAFAAKCGIPGLAGAWHTGFLSAAMPQTQFIHIKRRDKLGQALSLVRANLSGQFHSHRPAKQVVTAEDYDRAKINDAIKLIDTTEAALDQFAALLEREIPTYWYEDICAQPTAFIESVTKLLGLPEVTNPGIEVGLDILRDDVSDNWRQRYEAGD